VVEVVQVVEHLIHLEDYLVVQVEEEVVLVQEQLLADLEEQEIHLQLVHHKDKME
tara:strand:- start:261 stop:425 length:165 start_codon:yes stop_codon:yes gene_type:complete